MYYKRSPFIHTTHRVCKTSCLLNKPIVHTAHDSETGLLFKLTQTEWLLIKPLLTSRETIYNLYLNFIKSVKIARCHINCKTNTMEYQKLLTNLDLKLSTNVVSTISSGREFHSLIGRGKKENLKILFFLGTTNLKNKIIYIITCCLETGCNGKTSINKKC